MAVAITLYVVIAFTGVVNKRKLPLEISASNDASEAPVKIVPYSVI